jgi:hypothetical protein
MATLAPRPTAWARACTRRAATNRVLAQPRDRFTLASETGTATPVTTATMAHTSMASTIV